VFNRQAAGNKGEQNEVPIWQRAPRRRRKTQRTKTQEKEMEVLAVMQGIQALGQNPQAHYLRRYQRRFARAALVCRWVFLAGVYRLDLP
jgi:hypothetical protein